MGCPLQTRGMTFFKHCVVLGLLEQEMREAQALLTRKAAGKACVKYDCSTRWDDNH